MNSVAFSFSCPGLVPLLLGFLPAQTGEPTDFAALVNKRNSLREVSHQELVRLFRAETRFWANGRRVELLLPRSGSAEKDFLLSRVYRMDESELKRYWIELVYQNKIAAPPKVMPSSAVMQVVLDKQDGGLGIVTSAERREDGPPLLAIDGKRPGDAGYWLRKGDSEDQAPVGEPRDAIAPQDDELRRRVDQLELELATIGTTEPLDPFLELGGMQLRGFGDVTLGLEEPENGHGSGAVALGQLDLFMTAQVSERARFLGELVFETSDEGETVSDLERLVISYDLDEDLTVRAGRIHTAVGLWNARFHHGEWLQATIERPRIVDFEDDGGLLPVHLVGLSLEYRHPFEPLAVEGFLQVGNGRGPTPDRVQTGDDANDAKCVNVQLSCEPAAVPGLVVGVGGYLDDIPANADAGAGSVHGALDERILSAFAAWSGDRTSVLGEYYGIEHDDGTTQAESRGWFLQLEREYGDWTPYIRFESSTIDDAEAFYSTTRDEERLVLGLRWDVSTWNALKLQLESGRSDDTPDEDFLAVRLQTAFAF